MKLGSIKINSTRGLQGDWVDDLPQMGDLRLKVRSFANSDYQSFMAKETAAVPRDQREGGRRDGALKPAVREALMVRGIVETILIDWDNFTDDDDRPIVYSKDQALTYLTDPDYRPFRDAVVLAAGIVEEIESDKVQAVSGNSVRASDGTSAGAPKPNT